MLVADASVVAAALVDAGPSGDWALDVFSAGGLLAPDHLLVEVASALRRGQLSGHLSGGTATQAHRDLVRLPVDLVPYARCAERAWQLRDTVSSYDAAYVAVAEHTGAPLATLDGRLLRAPGTRCRFLTFSPASVTDVDDEGR